MLHLALSPLASPSPAAAPRGVTYMSEKAEVVQSFETSCVRVRVAHHGRGLGVRVQGVLVQSSGHRGIRRRENQHHQTLRAPAVLAALPGDHWSRLRPEGDQLGQQDAGPVTAVGYRR